MILHGLKSERLIFNQLTKSDTYHLLEYYGDPKVAKYYFITDDVTAHCIKTIEKQYWRYKKYNSGLAKLTEKHSGKFIGLCGLLHQELDNQICLEIGYGLVKKYWGRGYAIEAARFCRDFAFQNKLSDELISLIHPENVASQRVAVKNGMQYNDVKLFNDIPHRIYYITRSKWQSLSGDHASKP
ncbi:MAG: GNAT family N-acetyltransferase [Fulvivirga sp.]|nr:GNAT family N-acetyltransferase [Fulvivirga sp.]